MAELMRRARLLAVLCWACGAALAFAQNEPGSQTGTTGPTRFVDPFIGTDGTGHTFPGPARPFGMIQPGPDNADLGWE